MHSHYGLQEQLLNAAPLIIESPEETGKADQQVVILLSDFSLKPPEQILSELKGGMENMKGMGKSGTPKMNRMSMKPMKQKLLAQQWDESAQRFVAVAAMGELPDTDVKYDALLALLVVISPFVGASKKTSVGALGLSFHLRPSAIALRGGCLYDNPNNKTYRLLPGIQKPGQRSSGWKSKSSIRSRSCPCGPEKFEISGDSFIGIIHRVLWFNCQSSSVFVMVD